MKAWDGSTRDLPWKDLPYSEKLAYEARMDSQPQVEEQHRWGIQTAMGKLPADVPIFVYDAKDQLKTMLALDDDHHVTIETVCKRETFGLVFCTTARICMGEIQSGFVIKEMLVEVESDRELHAAEMDAYVEEVAQRKAARDAMPEVDLRLDMRDVMN